MRMMVCVKIKMEAMHRWENAPDKVSFLRNAHRHIFCITAKKQVSGDDRELEFFLFKNEIECYLKAKYPRYKSELFSDLGGTSCEMIAVDLMEQFQLDECAVYEDEENGAEVRKD